MIKFVALSFTAFCRELAHGRKAPAHIPEGFFVFNCHRDHVFGTPNMEADFGDDSPCSELVDLMSRYMSLNTQDSLDYILEVQAALRQAEVDSRCYCLNMVNVANPRETKKLLVLGALVQEGNLASNIGTDWLNSRNGLESWLENSNIEVIR